VASAFHKLSTFAKCQHWDLKLLTWAFMFVGERCFEGTRVFSTQGIDKAILNLFRMYARMGTQVVTCFSTGAQDPLTYADPWGKREPPDIAGFATLSDDKRLDVLIYNHHDDWDREGDYIIELEITDLPFDGDEVVVMHYRIDQAHSNAYAEWLRQGRPMYPTPGQRAALKARDDLEVLEPLRAARLTDGKVTVIFTLPVHGVSLLSIAPARA
jgi:xylan 1,4-beta-xylosidase